jgi:hypothetical protein
LTCDTSERVDTGVLPIIFEMARPESPLYAGRPIDVLNQRSPVGNAVTVAMKDTQS